MADSTTSSTAMVVERYSQDIRWWHWCPSSNKEDEETDSSSYRPLHPPFLLNRTGGHWVFTNIGLQAWEQSRAAWRQPNHKNNKSKIQKKNHKTLLLDTSGKQAITPLPKELDDERHDDPLDTSTTTTASQGTNNTLLSSSSSHDDEEEDHPGPANHNQKAVSSSSSPPSQIANQHHHQRWWVRLSSSSSRTPSNSSSLVSSDSPPNSIRPSSRRLLWGRPSSSRRQRRRLTRQLQSERHCDLDQPVSLSTIVQIYQASIWHSKVHAKEDDKDVAAFEQLQQQQKEEQPRNKEAPFHSKHSTPKEAPALQAATTTRPESCTRRFPQRLHPPPLQKRTN